MVNPQELNWLDRERYKMEKANPAFFAGSLLVPFLLLAIAVLLGNPKYLFYVHVASGALWFGTGILFSVGIGPSLDRASPEAAAEVNRYLTPKVTTLALGVSLTTVLSGTALLNQLGLMGAGFWPNFALVAGWGLWVFGMVFTHRYALKAFYESESENPDPERIQKINDLNAKIGVLEVVFMLGIIFVMTQLRF